jgi:hypothetical protein
MLQLQVLVVKLLPLLMLLLLSMLAYDGHATASGVQHCPNMLLLVLPALQL